jgi:heat shock protein HslJ
MQEVDAQNQSLMQQLPEEEMLREQARLLETLDPAVIAFLKNRRQKQQQQQQPNTHASSMCNEKMQGE